MGTATGRARRRASWPAGRERLPRPARHWRRVSRCVWRHEREHSASPHTMHVTCPQYPHTSHRGRHGYRDGPSAKEGIVASWPREAASSSKALAPRRWDSKRRTPGLVRDRSRSAATCGACASDTDWSMTRSMSDSFVGPAVTRVARASLRSVGKSAAPQARRRRFLRCCAIHARRSC